MANSLYPLEKTQFSLEYDDPGEFRSVYFEAYVRVRSVVSLQKYYRNSALLNISTALMLAWENDERICQENDYNHISYVRKPEQNGMFTIE